MRAYTAVFFFFQAEDGTRDLTVTGVQTCALPISTTPPPACAVLAMPGRAAVGLTVGREHGCVMKTCSRRMSIGRLGRPAYKACGLVSAPTTKRAAAASAMLLSSAG